MVEYRLHSETLHGTPPLTAHVYPIFSMQDHGYILDSGFLWPSGTDSFARNASLHLLLARAEQKGNKMNENDALSSQSSTWKNTLVKRGKCHNKTILETTVNLYLEQKTVEKAWNRSLNLSRITEQALSSIFDYLDTQTQTASSISLTEGSLQRETYGRVDQPGMIATLASWRSRVQIPARPHQKSS
jgi:hypothetical protein